MRNKYTRIAVFSSLILCLVGIIIFCVYNERAQHRHVWEYARLEPGWQSVGDMGNFIEYDGIHQHRMIRHNKVMKIFVHGPASYTVWLGDQAPTSVHIKTLENMQPTVVADVPPEQSMWMIIEEVSGQNISGDVWRYGDSGHRFGNWVLHVHPEMNLSEIAGGAVAFR